MENIFLLLFICSVCNAQENTTSIKLISRALPDSILLRWAPDNFEGWNAGNRYGYNIVRFTLMRDGQMLSGPIPEPLNTEPIKSWPLEKWEKLADVDDYAGVAAQAIYGETFELTNNKSTNIFDVVNKVKEQDSRFSFALFSADQSPAAAKASGLLYTDKNVKKGEKYLYRVFLAAPVNIITGDTAFAYTGVDEYLPLPKPLNLRCEFGDKSVIVHWDRKMLNNIYNAYDIERSGDSTNFSKINKQPLVYANTGDFEEADEMMFIDSIAINDKAYYYRVTGRTPFGETGPHSDVINGSGTIDIKSVPYLNESEEMNGQFTLLWSYPENENTRIKGFKILRSNNHITNFDTISGLLKPDTREFIDKKPLPTNYYKVLVQGLNGKYKSSLPSLMQLVDSIPPAPPTGLKAVADTTGRLVLSWRANTEEDIYGYRVYRANAAGDEYSQMTVEPARDTLFIDHINLKTLTTKIYYQLMAIDKRQNHSGFSEALEVERPDIVPPAPPALLKIKSDQGGVFIAWVNSSSRDVAKHLLYRRAKGQDSAELVKEFVITDTIHAFLDSTGIENTIYYYSLLAQDRNGLKSAPTPEMAGQKMASAGGSSLEDVNYETDRKKLTITLTWKQPSTLVARYIVYRKAGEEIMSAYTNIPGSKPEFTDTFVKPDTKYIYMIKPMPENGATGKLSKEITVLF